MVLGKIEKGAKLKLLRNHCNTYVVQIARAIRDNLNSDFGNLVLFSEISEKLKFPSY